MTTSTTDAEAIARETWRAIETYLDAECNLGSCGDLSDADRANCENFITNAILSYLASRREAQEPVAWRSVERKFYHSDWPLTKLLEARNGGLLTDEGEAWTYVHSHKDGSGGEYDLLRRREPAPPAPAGEVERLRGALNEIDALDPEGYVDGCSADALRGLVLRIGEIARAALNGGRHD